MREYIFHGKRVDNGEWVEGFYHYTNWLNPTTREIVETRHYIRPAGCQDAFCVIAETVGEYTGMKDKNGRKIFEGDITRLDEYVKSTFDVDDGIVQYGWGGFYIGGFSSLNSLNSLATFDGVLRGEVIGTVFENADLLEG